MIYHQIPLTHFPPNLLPIKTKKNIVFIRPCPFKFCLSKQFRNKIPPCRADNSTLSFISSMKWDTLLFQEGKSVQKGQTKENSNSVVEFLRQSTSYKISMHGGNLKNMYERIFTSIVIVACDGSPRNSPCPGRMVKLISFSLI